ncbi:MAG: glutamate--tRNA ligase, partial [Nitriliruptorales bacterium]
MAASLPTPLRVRFCPAPSGVLHVGSARTALFNWLLARRNDGAFVFRIEDTDVARATEESMRSMIAAMQWLRLDWDEGPEMGGPYGPYVQSERSGFHEAVARRLVAAGAAYEDWANAEELEEWRRTEREAGRPPTLKGPLRSEPRPGETGAASLRMRTPEDGELVVEDRVRGAVRFGWADVGDFIILRAGGAPTYALANSADDVAQGISVVCRGEDLLSVTPRQVLLYEAMTADGLIDEALDESDLPPRDPSWGAPAVFAHLPLIVGEDRQKLSKRHGSVAVEEFARQGYLPEVLVNYLSLLGWAPGDGRERLTVAELV